MCDTVLLATNKRRILDALTNFLRSKKVPFKSATDFDTLNNYIKTKSNKWSLLLIDNDLPNFDNDRLLFSFYKYYREELPVFLIHKHSQNIKKELLANLDIHQIFEYPINQNVINQSVLDIIKPDSAKRFESVSCLKEGNVFSCSFMNGHKFFLERKLIREDDGSGIKSIHLESEGYSFTVVLTSGKEYEVPWDFVRYHCDNAYRESVRTTEPFTEIGKKIKKIRESLGKTQEELAKATGMKRPNIARIESGKHEPSLETLKKLADALNLSIADFFYRSV